MPRKLNEIPPPADSSTEDEEETESEDEDQEEESKHRHAAAQNVAVEKQEETDDDDEEEEDEEEEEISPVKKATHSRLGDPDLDSESTQPSPSVSAFTIKLHKPSPKPSQVGSKRPNDSDSGLPPKKSKADDKAPKKGSAIQRLWSEGDELAILDGLVKYKSKKGADPSSDMAGFHDFIKESLHVDVSKNQLIDKIRRLKKKYRTNLERGENGKRPVFSKFHENEAFLLSEMFWGAGNDIKKSEIVKRNGKEQSSGDGGGVTLALPSLGTGKKQNSGLPNQEGKSVEKKIKVKAKNEVKGEKNTVEKHQSQSNGNMEDEGENFGEKYPFLAKSLDIGELPEGTRALLRKNLGMIEKSKLKELERKWERVNKAEVELFVQKTDLVIEQVKLALDSIKS